METIVNKVAQSGIITLDLEVFLPKEDQLKTFDLKPFLFMEMILKEKEFRAALKDLDWTEFENKQVAIHCSAEAIIPMWAYMLIANYLEPYTTQIYFGTLLEVKNEILLKNIEALDISQYENARMIIKGCGKHPLPEAAYLKITQKLKPVVLSLMYGEPCSTVPVYKKKR